MPPADLLHCMRSMRSRSCGRPACVRRAPSRPAAPVTQVNGFAAAFEKAQDDVGFAAVSNFFDMVTSAHSFATGGSNDHEYWGPPRTMADSLLLVRGLVVVSGERDNTSHISPLCAASKSPWHCMWGFNILLPISPCGKS